MEYLALASETSSKIVLIVIALILGYGIVQSAVDKKKADKAEAEKQDTETVQEEEKTEE